MSVANICHSFVPYFYNSTERRWEKNPYVWNNFGKKAGVLYIGTEMDLRTEVNPIFAAYVADVPQTHIMTGKYRGDEEERVKIASLLLKESNVFMENSPEYSVSTIEALIKKYSQDPEKNVRHIFLDYIYSNAELMKEFAKNSEAKGNIREDQVLLNLSTKLKNFTREYNVSIDAWTQTNNDYKNEANRDSSVIRGAKSMADKVDTGGIVSKPTEKELRSLKIIDDAFFNGDNSGRMMIKTPSIQKICISIYKNRGGEHKDIKIWLNIDYSTMRVHDLYVTDSQIQSIVTGLEKKNYVYLDKENNSTSISDKKMDSEAMTEEVLEDLKNRVNKEVKRYYSDIEKAKKEIGL